MKGSEVIVVILFGIVAFLIAFTVYLYSVCLSCMRLEIAYRLKPQEDPEAAGAQAGGAQA
jgi:hypothetical protein